MKSEVDQMRIVALYEELQSYRAVGEIVGCDHKTVKAAVERHRNTGRERPAVRRERVTDQVAELVRQKVEETKAKITAKRVMRLAQAAGYTGSARSLRRAVREAKSRYRAANFRIYRPWRSAPGEFLICDWGKAGTVPTPAGPKPLSMFCAVLGYSRLRFVHFTVSERFHALADGLHRCFEVLGGIPAKVMFDNPKTVTVDHVAGAAVLNPDIVRLAAHYGFLVVTAEVADPESKGKVEALVKFAKSDLLPHEGFGSLDEANAWGRTWCEEVNAEMHSETCAIPSERFESERALFRRLPTLRPSLAAGERRKVDRMSTVRIGAARYSVPTTLRGTWVEVSCDGAHLTVCNEGIVVATHALLPPGEASINDEHYPTPPPTGVRRLRPRTASEQAVLQLGPAAEAWLRAAAAGGVPGLKAQLDDILSLVRAHGEETVVSALERAVAFRRFASGDLRSIIAATAHPPAKDHDVQQLPLDGLPKVPVRDIADYRMANAHVGSPHSDATGAGCGDPTASAGLLFDPVAFIDRSRGRRRKR